MIVAAMTDDELRAVVRETVEEARKADDLLTQSELAQRFKVSTAMIQKLRERGMPVIWVGQMPRYDYPVCREWVATQKAGDQ